MTTTTTRSAATRAMGKSAPLVLHHADQISRRTTSVGAAAQQLISELDPPRSVVADAYMTHVRRIHRGQATGDAAAHLVRVLAASLERLPKQSRQTA